MSRPTGPVVKPDPFDAATLRFYHAEALVYAASGPDGVSPRLQGFVMALPPNARVLELGCGGGRDAAAMIGAGINLDATDASFALAAEAERRLGRQVRVMRFDELDADGAYDGIWAAACLLHVPRAALPDVLRRVHRALKPGGVHVATYKATGVEGRDGFGRLFNQPTPDLLVEAYRRTDSWFELLIEDYIGSGYDRKVGPWLAVTARKAG